MPGLAGCSARTANASGAWLDDAALGSTSSFSAIVFVHRPEAGHRHLVDPRRTLIEAPIDHTFTTDVVRRANRVALGVMRRPDDKRCVIGPLHGNSAAGQQDVVVLPIDRSDHPVAMIGVVSVQGAVVVGVIVGRVRVEDLDGEWGVDLVEIPSEAEERS